MFLRENCLLVRPDPLGEHLQQVVVEGVVANADQTAHQLAPGDWGALTGKKVFIKKVLFLGNDFFYIPARAGTGAGRGRGGQGAPAPSRCRCTLF